MRFSPALLAALALVGIAQASELPLPDDIVKNESQWMAAGVCLKRGYQFIDAIGETGQYWLCLHSRVAAPRAVDVRDILKARP